MADTIFTRALAQAADAQGSTQALATQLRVPENTLRRWMSGRAQMPLQAFLNLIEMVAQYEAQGGADTRAAIPAGNLLTFKIGEHTGHCVRCEGTEFALQTPGPLQMTSPLVCRACGELVVHGDLIAQLAKDAVHHSKAMTVARTRRQKELLERSPKLRAMRESDEKSGN